MFDGMNSPFISTEAQNAPGLAFTATPILGNVEFNIQAPPTRGEVEPGFPSFPYLSIESMLFFQAMTSTNIAPYNILGGSNTGQQVISGQTTLQDTTGTSRVAQGTQLSQGVG